MENKKKSYTRVKGGKTHLVTKFEWSKLYGAQMVINAIMAFSLTQCVQRLSALCAYGDWIHL